MLSSPLPSPLPGEKQLPLIAKREDIVIDNKKRISYP